MCNTAHFCANFSDMSESEILFFATLIVLVAYAVFGISGFGSTMISVPLLAHLSPLRTVIPTVLLLDCVASIGLGLRLRSGIHKAELYPLLPFLLLGLVLGVLLLVRLPG